MSSISELFRRRCAEIELSRREIAERAGYVNITKGMNRLRRLEDPKTYFPNRQVMERFAAVMGISEEEMDLALCTDFEELDRPVKPSVVARVMPAVYTAVKLPEDCSPEEAVEIAKQVSAETGMSCCVTLSKIRGVYVWKDGTIRESYGLPGSPLGVPAFSGRRAKDLKLQKDVADTPRESSGEKPGSR